MLMRGDRPKETGLALYARSGLSVFRQSIGSSVPVVNLCFFNFLVDYLIFVLSCTEILVQMTESTTPDIQSVDPKSAFCFMGDFNNYHHLEWLGSRVSNAHMVAAFDFATLTDCSHSQLVRGPTHQDCGILNLVLTDVPDLCQVSVDSSVCRSDHSALFLTLKLVKGIDLFSGGDFLFMDRS